MFWEHFNQCFAKFQREYVIQVISCHKFFESFTIVPAAESFGVDTYDVSGCFASTKVLRVFISRVKDKRAVVPILWFIIGKISCFPGGGINSVGIGKSFLNVGLEVLI
jgi:hypothetical protein